ncbi:MAG: HWE histidine kinase domain-containing protein [Pseudomonadota bacterium]
MNENEPMKAIDGTATSEMDRLESRLAHYDDKQAPLRAMLALDAGRMGSWRWDISGGTVTGDPFVADLLNMDFAAQPWPVGDVFASMHPDDLPHVQAKVDEALAGADIYEVEFRDTVIDPDTGTEGLRWLGARGRVTNRSETGQPLEMIGVNWDATQQKMHEERLAMLAGEMDHRVKNAFAVIRALINLGERTDGDKKGFAQTLRAQVQAMADAHAISAKLARQTQAPSAPVAVAEVVRTALAPWLEVEGGATRSDVTVTVQADDMVKVAPRNVSALAMLVYEFATNATKYGPLGELGGSLNVEVAREEDGIALMRWSETSENEHLRQSAEQEARDGIASGFGSMLIQHCVGTLRARVKRELTETGLHCEIHLPVIAKGHAN